MKEYYYLLSVENEYGDYNGDGDWCPIYESKILVINDTGKQDFNLPRMLDSFLFNLNLNPDEPVQLLGEDLSIDYDLYAE